MVSVGPLLSDDFLQGEIVQSAVVVILTGVEQVGHLDVDGGLRPCQRFGVGARLGTAAINCVVVKNVPPGPLAPVFLLAP